MNEQSARAACKQFGAAWSVDKVTDGSLVCTKDDTRWENNCDTCNTWRLIVWKDGGIEYTKGTSWYNARAKASKFHFTTKAGKYYAGHDPCVGRTDNFPLCGNWIGTNI